MVSQVDNKMAQALNNGGALRQVVATRSSSIDYFALGMSLPNPDEVLKALGQDIRVYRQLKADASCGGMVSRRKASVMALEHGFKGECAPQVLELLESQFAKLDMRSIILQLLDGVQFGYQPAEVMWSATGKAWVVTDIICKPPEWFVYSIDNELLFKSKQNYLGEVVPDYKFVVARNEPTYQNPYGFPVLSMCYWPVAFKKGGLRFWVNFSEKYGSPWLIGKHPRGTNEEDIDKLLDALDTLSQDAVGAIPDDSSVEIVEASGKMASAELYERLLMFCRSEMSIAQLGQNQTTEASANKASAQAGAEVTRDIRDGDAYVVAQALTQVARWIVALNFGVDEPCPEYAFWEQEEVDDLQATRDQKLMQAGARFSNQYFARAYNLQDGDLLPPLAQTPPPVANTPPVAFAEADAPDYADQNTDKLVTDTASTLTGWLNRIRNTVAKSDSLETLQQDLIAEFSELPSDELRQVMGIAYTAANLAGRSEVQDGE